MTGRWMDVRFSQGHDLREGEISKAVPGCWKSMNSDISREVIYDVDRVYYVTFFIMLKRVSNFFCSPQGCQGQRFKYVKFMNLILQYKIAIFLPSWNNTAFYAPFSCVFFLSSVNNLNVLNAMGKMDEWNTVFSRTPGRDFHCYLRLKKRWEK